MSGDATRSNLLDALVADYRQRHPDCEHSDEFLRQIARESIMADLAKSRPSVPDAFRRAFEDE